MVKKQDIVVVSPDILGGTPVFSGTRVPIQSLFDFIESGETIDEFLENFPTVRREQVIMLLETAREYVAPHSSGHEAVA